MTEVATSMATEQLRPLNTEPLLGHPKYMKVCWM